MISRSHRFHGRGSLKFVYQNGQTVRGGQLALRYSVNNRRSDYRAAVIVSRKVHKSAVVRNRIRRRLYECLRQHEAALNQPVYDVILTVYAEQLATITPLEVQQQLQELLSKAHIIAPPADA